MADVGVPDPFDDGADWEGMIDPTLVPGPAWDSNGGMHEDESFFALLNSLDAQEPGDPAFAPVVDEQPSKQQSSGGTTGGSRGAASGMSRDNSDEVDLAVRRMEKIREKNRRAQARHREKVKGQRAQIEIHIQQKQEALTSIKAHHAALKATNVSVKQRNEKAAATLEATLHITSMFPPSVSTSEAGGSQAITAEGSANKSDGEGVESAPAPVVRSAAPAIVQSSATGHAGSINPALVPRAPKAALFVPDLEVGPPLTTYSYHVGVNYEEFLDCSGCASSAPAWAGQGEGQSGRLRDMLEAHRISEAARLTCNKSDIAWYAQMKTMVADGKRLSFSSTVGSPACCTSFITYFLLLTLEQCLSVELMVKSGKQEELQGFQSLLDSGLGGSGKRQRGANAAQPFLPLRESLAELEDVPQWLHDYGVTEEMIDNMTMRCDVWESVPLREGMRFVLQDLVSRYRGLMNSADISKVLATVVLTECQVLKMIVHVIQEMLADTLENPESLSFPELSEYERSFFHSLNKHVVGMLLLCRREATAIITDICQGADRDAPPRLEVGVDQAVQHHTAHVLWGWALGESLTLADAPRCTLHMMYNAVSPFIAFFEVDNMHARLYKDMIISSDQRTRMAAYWIQWKRNRRRLDKLLDSACDHLESLPMDLDLPAAFLTHLSTLCCPPEASPQDSIMHDAHGFSSGGVGLRASKRELDLLGCTTRFLGQSGEDMAQGNGAVQVLRDMHMQDRDLYMDNLAAQMPGVFVSPVQAMRMWSEYMMFRVAPGDFLALCQLAATQQHRQKLFQGCR